MSRWKLETLDGSDSYTFGMSPNEQDSPVPNREVTWDFNPGLGWSGKRAGRLPKQWSFSGILRTQEQYEALRDWANKRVKIRLTDDRGDSFIVRLLEFEPTQRAAARNVNVPYRMTYTMRGLLYEMEASS